MDTHLEASREQALSRVGAFSRVVCGIDGSREGFEAARQAARLTDADGRLLLVAVAEFYAALSGRWGPEPARWRWSSASERSVDKCYSDLRERAEASLALAKRQADGPAEVATRVVDGDVDVRLLEAVDAESATLLVLGTHAGSRLAGAAFAEATTMLLHEAPVSVLIARPPFEPERFPASIVAGIHGSPEARRALDVAAALRERSGGRLTVAVATGDGNPAVAALDGFDAPHELVTYKARPVDALVTAAQTADLLVVGSRGLHGARALGSVSERVAHRAPSSVLVIRPTAPEVVEREG
jgi:nucleotide-binding universal stress UspA family protein